MREDTPAAEACRLTVRIPTAMAMLGLGRSKIYDLMDNGEIKTVKAGKARLIIVQSLHEFISRHQAR